MGVGHPVSSHQESVDQGIFSAAVAQIEASPAPTIIQTFAVLFGGTTALLITGLQPLVLGNLAEVGRLGGNEIGLAATAELLALGVATSLSGALLKSSRLRLTGLLAALTHAAATLATIAAAGLGVILARGVAGLAAGVMLWIAIGMIARAKQPERWAGSFLTGQTLAQLAVAAILPVIVLPRFGVNGALLCLAGISVLAGFSALLGPGSYAPLADARSHVEIDGGKFGLRSLIALSAVFAFMAAVTVVFVYLEPLGDELGLKSDTVSTAVAVVLGFQVLGGLAATLIGSRLPFAAAFGGSIVLGLAAFGVLAHDGDPFEFVAASAALGFVWLFALPYLLPFLIEVDPSRRAALQLPAAQLLGSAAGPMLASFLVSDTEFRPALVLASACLVLALALLAGLHLLRPRRP